MTLVHIITFIGLAVIYRVFVRESFRGWFLFVTSALAIYWLQPSTPIRYLDFWLPTATLVIVTISWLLTTPPDERLHPANLHAVLTLGGICLSVALLRYLPWEVYLTPSRPPQVWMVLIGLAIIAGVTFGIYRSQTSTATGLWVGIVLLTIILVVIKTAPLSEAASRGLRFLMGQSIDRAAANDIRWLGYSYVFFRLVHTLRDRQNGKLQPVHFHEYVVYVIFPPAFTAGPIDRVERFVKDLRAPLRPLDCDVLDAGKRISLGLLKKFILADSLALVALNPQNAGQVTSTGWSWVFLYAYAFQIYFDFSGYTDIAIGLGILYGIRLPENFNHPYLKSNLQTFWNNWHITLTQWFRTYFFNPVTRWLRKRKVQAVVVVFITQIATMVLIGLWHGIAFNFIVWGLWHGIGLFLQNRYSDWIKPKLGSIENRPGIQKALQITGTILTFHYVALGWIWFVLPDMNTAFRFFAKLIGM
jgi:D-alanyl-lipoteichoic acid acyltransferase DltB (MBOAT superfamily)